MSALALDVIPHPAFFPMNQREGFSFYLSQLFSLSIPLFHLTRKQRNAAEPQHGTILNGYFVHFYTFLLEKGNYHSSTYFSHFVHKLLHTELSTVTVFKYKFNTKYKDVFANNVSIPEKTRRHYLAPGLSF